MNVPTVDYSILKPQQTFSEGMQQSQQNRMTSQMNKMRMQGAQVEQEAQQYKLEQLKRERQVMLDFQQQLQAQGKSPDLNSYLDVLIQSGIPENVEKGLMGKQKLQEQRQYAQIMGFPDPVQPTQPQEGTPSALTPSNPANNALMSQASPVAPPANAVAAPRTGSPIAQNFGADQVATITNRIQQLTALGTPQAMQTAKLLQDQLEMVARQKGTTGARILPPGSIMVDELGNRLAMNPRVTGSGGGGSSRVAAPVASTGPGTRLKPGEVYNEALDRIEAKPGSDLYVKQSGQHAKDYKAAKTTADTLDNSISKIDKILNPANKGAFAGNFGGYNAYATRMLPDNSNLRKTIDSLKSDLKQAGMEMMRQGGSIGQMTEKEWPIVEQMIASIDPVLSESEARNIFESVKARFQHIKESARDTYDSQWGQTQYHRNTFDKQSGGTPTLRAEDRQALEWAAANPADPRATEIKRRLGVR